MMNKIIYLFLFVAMLSLAGCTSTDYQNAIPGESTMLISIKPSKVSGANSQTLLRAIMHVSNLDEVGLDFSSDIFFFEDAQGNLGVCAKVDDTDKLRKTAQRLGATLRHKRDYDFAALNNNWIMGWSDKALLLMGPVIPDAQDAMMVQMAKYLGEDEDDGIKASPIYDKLDSINAPMSLVCQAQALPEQLVAPFTLGAPRDANPAQILIAAELKIEKGKLWVNGETFSFKSSINSSLQKARAVFRPIQGKYVKTMSDSDALGMFMNVDGTQFIQLVRQNRGLQAMLAGINSAIDMDNIIKSVNGDMYIITPTLDNSHFQLMMAAKLANANWLADVDYWKQSVPKGGHIGDWGRDCYYYEGDKTTYYFGVTQDWQYMSGGSKQAALQSIKPSANPIDKDLQDNIVGKKLVMVINFRALNGTKAQAVSAMMKPLFGDIHAIIYNLK